MSALEARLAEVVAEHVLRVRRGDGCFCDCGWSVGRGPEATATHAGHVAAILAAEVAAPDEQAARQAAQDRAAEAERAAQDCESECEMWINGLVETYDPDPDSADPDREQRIDISVPALAALVAEQVTDAVRAVLAPTAPQTADEGERP